MQQEGYGKIGWSLDTGLKRPLNQDSLATAHLQAVGHATTENMDMLALADGMGGYREGEIASEMAVRASIRALMDQISRDPNVPENYQQWILSAVNVTNHLVYRTAMDHQSNMGTTLVLALVVGNRVHVANVGDSRAYVITNNHIRQITKDHSLLQEIIDSGEIDPSEFAESRLKNTLTRAIGRDETVEVDTYEVYIPDGSYVLLCSDGLWGEVAEEDILRIIQESETADIASQNLVDAANAAGGRDNIAVVLAEINHSSLQ